jgi:excisionase family DNA binding protein
MSRWLHSGANPQQRTPARASRSLYPGIPKMSNEELLTVVDVAARLRVTEETVREWLRRQVIHGYNFGGRTGWRIPATEIPRLLATKVRKRP